MNTKTWWRSLVMVHVASKLQATLFAQQAPVSSQHLLLHVGLLELVIADLSVAEKAGHVSLNRPSALASNTGFIISVILVVKVVTCITLVCVEFCRLLLGSHILLVYQRQFTIFGILSAATNVGPRGHAGAAALFHREVVNLGSLRRSATAHDVVREASIDHTRSSQVISISLTRRWAIRRHIYPHVWLRVFCHINGVPPGIGSKSPRLLRNGIEFGMELSVIKVRLRHAWLHNPLFIYVWLHGLVLPSHCCLHCHLRISGVSRSVGAGAHRAVNFQVI